MMNIEVEGSPNGDFHEQLVFKELGKPRKVRSIRALRGDHEVSCDIVGVDRGGRWMPAYGVKVMDSSEGHAFLIYGGPWGLRFRPDEFSKQLWSFDDPNQWGEPLKVYGSEEDIVYETRD